MVVLPTEDPIPPRRRVRLLHTSDVHLASDGGWRAGDHLDQCLCSLDGLGRLASEHDVDAVLVAGDLFDHARLGEDFVARVFATVDQFPTEVVLLVGNHDVHDHTSLYDRYSGVMDGSSVRVILDHDGAEMDIVGGAVRIWGKAMDEHSPDYRPLEGVPAGPEDRWFVVMGHGLHVGDSAMSTAHSSSLIRATDISATRADYVALGHHHTTADVSTHRVTAWYSGSPSGFGDCQALIVDLDPVDGVNVTPVPVQPSPEGCAAVARR